MKFADIGLTPAVMAGIEANQFVECTPIQEVAIPHILTGRDVAGLAQTGTGKTAAFVLPIMDRIVRSRMKVEEQPTDEANARPVFKNWRPLNFILILVPTRELAEQVYEHVTNFGKSTNMKAVAIYGGTSYEPQKAALKQGVEFVVATPGRLIDLYKDHLVDLNQVRAVVFDEADRMFDMGFKDDMKFILRRIPQDRQFLVFSATLNFDVLNTAYEFGANPVEINVSRDQAKAENVTDEILHVGHTEKPKFLLSILRRDKPQQAIIFSNFKHNVDRIAKFLSQNEIPAMGISSLISQSQRTRIMELFKATNDRNILVATDLAARGLDIKGVDMVINFELPDDAENYVHRIGRTGRAGASGKALSLVSERDVEALQRIETYLAYKVAIGWVDDKDVAKEFKQFPADESRRSFAPRPSGDRPRPRHERDARPQGPRRDDHRRTDAPRTGTGNRPQQRSDLPQGRRPDNRPRHGQSGQSQSGQQGQQGGQQGGQQSGQQRSQQGGHPSGQQRSPQSGQQRTHQSGQQRTHQGGQQRPHQSGQQSGRPPQGQRPNHNRHQPRPNPNQQRAGGKVVPKTAAPNPNSFKGRMLGLIKKIFSK